MLIPTEIADVLEGALHGQAPSKSACVRLLQLHEHSLEAHLLMSVADVVSRQRFENRAILLGQIGIGIAPCPGNCRFCTFGESHTSLPAEELPIEEILRRAHGFADDGDLYALFLMTMHAFDFAHLLSVVSCVRQEIKAHTQIVVNMGDFDTVQAGELRAAGVNGAYHVCRLREGQDTDLDPEARKRTLSTIQQAGLDLYYCCEPVGPEHTPEEIVEQLWVGIDYGCFQHAAMRRVALPHSPLYARGQITEQRMAQIVAVVALATLACPNTRNIAVHEPNLLGLVAGANVVYAESGANPRDTVADTAAHRGLDMAACRKMMYESGFAGLLRGDQTVVPLDLAYLHRALTMARRSA
jgi:biotin synthase